LWGVGPALQSVWAVETVITPHRHTKELWFDIKYAE
jgi:hypothetical protein